MFLTWGSKSFDCATMHTLSRVPINQLNLQCQTSWLHGFLFICRFDAKHLFECFLEVAAPTSDDEPGFVLQTFPEDAARKDADRIKSVPPFVFPCKLEV